VLLVVFGTQLRDAQCGFKALCADAARTLLDHVENDEWFFDTEPAAPGRAQRGADPRGPGRLGRRLDSRVRILRTAWEDLRGVARMRRTFWRGGGRLTAAGAAVDKSAT